MMLKKKFISVILLVTIIFSVLSGYSDVFALEKQSDASHKAKQNNLQNHVTYEDSQEDESDKEYSRAYKKYLELSDEERAEVKVIPRMYDVPLDMLYEQKPVTKGLLKSSVESTLPKYFNLNDVIDIQVENQGWYGLCWAFASIKPLETYLSLRQQEYDLSEMHLGYLSTEDFGWNRTLDSGGNFSDFQRYIRNSYGPVLEEDVPYRDHAEEEYDYLAELSPVVGVTKTIDFPSIWKEYEEYTRRRIGIV